MGCSSHDRVTWRFKCPFGQYLIPLFGDGSFQGKTIKARTPELNDPLQSARALGETCVAVPAPWWDKAKENLTNNNTDARVTLLLTVFISLTVVESIAFVDHDSTYKSFLASSRAWHSRAFLLFITHIHYLILFDSRRS